MVGPEVAIVGRIVAVNDDRQPARATSATRAGIAASAAARVPVAMRTSCHSRSNLWLERGLI